MNIDAKKIKNSAREQGDTPPSYDRHGRFFSYSGIAGAILGVMLVVLPLVGFFGDTYKKPLLFAGLASLAVSLIFLVSGVERLFRSARTASSIAKIMKDTKERFARAAAGSHEGLWDLDTATGESFFSEAWHAMLGFPPEKIRTVAAWMELVHPNDRIVVSDAIKEHIGGYAASYSVEYRIQTRGGAFIWFSDRGSTDGGTRIAGFSRDITAQKKVEEALQSRTEELTRLKEAVEREVQNTLKFQQAVESATDAITIVTPAGNITYVNRAREVLSGYAVRDMHHTNIVSLYRDKTPQNEIFACEQALRAGRAFSSENFIGTRKDGGTFGAAVSFFPVRDKGVVLFYTSLEQDITKRKEVDRAKTEFVSLASHQLRTPLTAIRWYSEMLLKEKERTLSERDRKYLHEIYDANRRMIELINALLNVSRIDLGAFAIDPHPTDLSALAESVIAEMIPQTIIKRIRLEKNWSAPLVPIAVDPQLFRIVFQNLVSNAIKYTREEGRVSVSITQDGDRTLFSVADDGIGIPEVQKIKIFTKLFRADNAQEIDLDGTGLGLYIVKAVMEASGGEIRFESEEGKGTTFYGIIPMKGSLRREGSKSLAPAVK